jgi:molybdenum transport protein
MIFIPDHTIDQWLLEDVALGDVTTRSLGLTAQTGKIAFYRRQAGRVSGTTLAARVLARCGLTVDVSLPDGIDADADACLVRAHGRVDRLHQAAKVAQNVLEWASGVAAKMARMVAAARAVYPDMQIACTRKSIPGTRFLATTAILDGGGLIHRVGMAETILLFKNHRRFFPEPFDWEKYVSMLRRNAPEKKIVVEVETPEEMCSALAARPDAIQFDKFSPEQIRACCALARQSAGACLLIAAGGIDEHNVADFAATGVSLLVTSAPYYALPADIRVVIEPDMA